MKSNKIYLPVGILLVLSAVALRQLARAQEAAGAKQQTVDLKGSATSSSRDASAGGDDEDRQTASNTQKFFTSLQRRDLLIDLDDSRIRWELSETREVELPRESLEHPQGIFYCYDNRLWPLSSKASLPALFNERAVRLINTADFISEDAALATARVFISANFPSFFDGKEILTESDGPDGSGLYAFKWQKYRSDEMPGDNMWVSVRSLDGKVTAFSASRLSGEWEHKIKPSEALAKVKAYFQKDARVREVSVGRWHVTGGGGKRYFTIGVSATDAKNGQPVGMGVLVDAMDGSVIEGTHGWEVTTSPTASELLPQDHLPVWTKRGLVFSSTRELAKMPSWAAVPEQLFVRDAENQISYVTSDLRGGEFKSTNAAAQGNWLVTNWGGWGYALNLSNGDYRVTAVPERSLVTPAINPDGSWMVGAGMAKTGNAGLDLMPDNLERVPSLALRGRLLIPKSDEHTPVFSEDGKWLYFLKARQDDFRSLSLHRIPATLARTMDRAFVKDEQQETIVEKIPFLANRLSISPDGEKLIAQAPSQYVQQNGPRNPPTSVSRIFIIGTGSKQVRELKFPTLKDAEVNATIQEINDAWAGPGNDEVTFSGKTIDANKKERRRIYSCRFDGSNLKALTPAENTPVPAYKFPQGNKTAYELAKEMALGEIQWEDAHRDQ